VSEREEAKEWLVGKNRRREIGNETLLLQCHGDLRFHDLSLSLSSSPQFSLPFPCLFFILFGNTAKPAPMSPYTNYPGDFRLHDLSLFPSASPFLSFPFPDFFSILFGNTAKTALVSPLHQCHGVFRSRDLSLSPAPFLFSFLIRFGNIA